MVLRALAMAGGLAGAGTLSQFPEFSTQYQQRLAGAVDALGVVVADFDRSAAADGLSRAAALAQMTGTPFLDRRRRDMERTFARFEDLSADLVQISTASPMERLAMPRRFLDREIASAAYTDFRPAVPLTPAGLVSAAVGFFAGMTLVAVLLRLGALLIGVGRQRRPS